jgi:hypothetical protein
MLLVAVPGVQELLSHGIGHRCGISSGADDYTLRLRRRLTEEQGRINDE